MEAARHYKQKYNNFRVTSEYDAEQLPEKTQEYSALTQIIERVGEYCAPGGDPEILPPFYLKDEEVENYRVLRVPPFNAIVFINPLVAGTNQFKFLLHDEDVRMKHLDPLLVIAIRRGGGKPRE